jgi:predicted DNA-binding transcriptional regulator AlpA
MCKKLINEREASELFGMSTAWFQRKRWEGGGPLFLKIDKKSIRYQISDLNDYFIKKKLRSTSETIGNL